jgi:hypothetical protein
MENWTMFSLVVITLGNVFRVQGGHPNMVIYPKIVMKWQKFEGWCSLLVMMLGNRFRVYGGLLNMVIYLHIPRK